MDSVLGQRAREATQSSTRTDEIRAIAAQLFENRGYSTTTMADIASAAGVFPGSLYHHFESKEEIAVELLEALIADLERTASRLSRLDSAADAETRLRHLTSEAMGVSYRHAAAVRLRAYEAPSVATARLRNALQLTATSLDRLWRQAIDQLGAQVHAGAAESRLLRFALESLAINASIHYPTGIDPADLAAHLCDVMLHGLALEIDEDELERSDALAAAKQAVAEWGRAPVGPEEQKTVRDKIVAAARVEFARRGYAATTVRDIATAADVTMGTLYRHAASKDALAREVIDTYGDHFGRGIRAALTTGDSEPAALDALAWVFVHAARRFREESEIVKGGWLDRTTSGSPGFAYFQATEERLALLQRTLERGVAKGSLRPLGAAADVAPHLRFTMWLPYQDLARTSAVRTHTFLRRTVLRGFLTRR